MPGFLLPAEKRLRLTLPFNLGRFGGSLASNFFRIGQQWAVNLYAIPHLQYSRFRRQDLFTKNAHWARSQIKLRKLMPNPTDQ